MTNPASDRNQSPSSAGSRTRAAIEFKGISHPAVRVVLHDASTQALREAALRGGPGGEDGFEWQPAVIDLGALEAGEPDLESLCATLTALKLHPVAVAGGPEAMLSRAAALRLGWLSALHDARRGEDAPAHRSERAPTPQPERAAPPAAGPGTLTVERSVRSGQQLYARNGDLIVIGQVSPGAELIADGNIHVYGSLQGRAIAGAGGRRDVGIFALDLQAELVAVGGIYRTFEDGVPVEHRGRAVRVELEGASDKLTVRPL